MSIKTFESFNEPNLKDDSFRSVHLGNSSTNSVELYDDDVDFGTGHSLSHYDNKKRKLKTVNFTELEKKKISRLLSSYDINWVHRHINVGTKYEPKLKEVEDITLAQMVDKNPPKDVYSKNSFMYNILKVEDAWFYVMLHLNHRIESIYYQCDQFHGLKNCIKHCNELLDSFPIKYDKD